jgi:hypothetical protein
MADIPNPFDFRTGRLLRFSQQLRKTGKSMPHCVERDRIGVSGVPLGIWNVCEGLAMHIDIIALQPLVALIFGILILILPRLLNYLIAIYLILVGLTGLFPHLFTSSV